MKKQYTISEERFEKAKELIIKNGLLYKDRTFNVKGVKGRYKKEGDQIVVHIISKPWAAPWSMIEDKIDEFFSK